MACQVGRGDLPHFQSTIDKIRKSFIRRWKRLIFWQFAAFFPIVRARQRLQLVSPETRFLNS